MKKAFFGLTILVTSFVLYSFTSSPNEVLSSTDGKNVNWMTWEEAMTAMEADKKAGKTDKQVFVDVYTDWCGWCKRMEKQTFEHPQIAKYLNQHFYPVKFNAEQKGEIQFNNHIFRYIGEKSRRGVHELAYSLLDGKLSYPTVVFLNEDLQLMQRIKGFLDVETFDMIIHYMAERAFKNTPWNEYQVQFKAKKKNSDAQAVKN